MKVGRVRVTGLDADSYVDSKMNYQTPERDFLKKMINKFNNGFLKL